MPARPVNCSADYRRRSRVPSAQTGAVTCVQRFGGSLNLNPHLHVLWLDGVFVFHEGTARFHPAEPPSRDDLERIVQLVARRVVRWLGRKGLLDARLREERPNVLEAPSPLDACAQMALAPGAFGAAGDHATHADDHDDARWSQRQQRFAAEHERFNLHAGVCIPAANVDGRERLCRYALRPCFALERLSILPNGRVAYQVKAPRSRRATHRLMTPLEFLARASALIPPPRFPLVRYHGVLAPNSPYRSRVIPRPPVRMSASSRTSRPREKCPERGGGDPHRTPLSDPQERRGGATNPPEPQPRSADMAWLSPSVSGPPSDPTTGARMIDDDGDLPLNVLPLGHWDRLLGGLLLCTSPRLDWATLMRRTYATDVLECSKCHGRLRVLAAITAPEVAREILGCLRLPTTAPRAARVRDPTWDDDAQTELPWAE